MYSNIPITETKQILADVMEHNLIDAQVTQELLKWYDVTRKQNYFINNNDIIIQNDGLAMGAPSSNIIAEMFLQHIENLHLAHRTQKHKIINYFRCVEDIFLIFEPNYTNIQAILNYCNAMHPKLHFTADSST
jgi:DNA-directed RNA polymerase subunit H (RpoH/RPB5)